MEMAQIEKRFGVLAVELGFITPNQLVDALKTQVMDDIEQRKRKLIGTILLEKGIMAQSQIDEVVAKLMRKE